MSSRDATQHSQQNKFKVVRSKSPVERSKSPKGGINKDKEQQKKTIVSVDERLVRSPYKQQLTKRFKKGYRSIYGSISARSDSDNDRCSEKNSSKSPKRNENQFQIVKPIVMPIVDEDQRVTPSSL